MDKLSTDYLRRLRDARREKGLTQSALASDAGCTQSAISMLEQGRTDAVNSETLEKIAGLLGIPLPDSAAVPATATAAASRAERRFCPQADCFSNAPFVVNGDLLFWPRAQNNDATRCVYCGEVLESRCPHCGAATAEGACCGCCGKPLVTHTIQLEETVEVWAEKRRQAIAAWRALL